jgi:hypothetical protein
MIEEWAGIHDLVTALVSAWDGADIDLDMGDVAEVSTVLYSVAWASLE